MTDSGSTGTSSMGLPEEQPPITWGSPDPSGSVHQDQVALVPAPIWKRAFARLMDICLWALVAVIELFVQVLVMGTDEREHLAELAAAYAIIMIMEWGTRGRTLGKVIVGLRVIRLDSQPLGWAASTVRVLPLGLSLLWTPLNRFHYVGDPDTVAYQWADTVGTISILIMVVLALAIPVVMAIDSKRRTPWDLATKSLVVHSRANG